MYKGTENKGTEKTIMISNDDIDKFINIVKTQTNYDDYYAIQKLKQYDYDYMKVIREYMGIKEKMPAPIKSVNQEIYKMIRKQIDISQYNLKISEQMANK